MGVSLLIEEKQGPDVVTAKRTPVYCNRPAKVMFTVNRYLKLNLDYYSGRVYGIPNILPDKKFDVVFMGAQLPHPRDPIGALLAAGSVCEGMMVSTTRVADNNSSRVPVMSMPWGSISRRAWRLPNPSCYKMWHEAPGFRDVDVSQEVMMAANPKATRDNGQESPVVVSHRLRLAIGHASAQNQAHRLVGSNLTRRGHL